MTLVGHSILFTATALSAVLGCRRPEANGGVRAHAHPNPSVAAATAADGPSAAAEPFAVPADAIKGARGFAWKVLVPRTTGAASPTLSDRVTVRFTGWTPDGRRFSSSPEDGGPATFWMAALIPGWEIGLKLMVPGEKRRFWIPAHLAYGDESNDPKAPAGPLIYDIELVSVAPGPAAPDAPPADVAAIPRNAKKTRSGLAYRVLRPGPGTRHPQPTDTVEVHYSGWRTDGRLFDTSTKRGLPATLVLTNVTPGWREALQLMVEGEKTRFWIPSPLIYGPSARLLDKASRLFVFEIELATLK
jgi:FKBP-type peptidyl-prolyl cis-trans isomerase